jgi:DNA-directed RNA polymerase specialized sigma24 family protein
MNARSNCHCAICELEQGLFRQLDADQTEQNYRELASKSSILSGFPTAWSLLRHVREQRSEGDTGESCDDILGELLPPAGGHNPELRQAMVLLILMPAVHKTSRQIMAGFPSLARDDIAQHLLTTVLEIFNSKPLLRQESHFAFTITRLTRRHSFRWALHETTVAPTADLEPLASIEPVLEADTDFESGILLRRFLQECLSSGLLTRAERELLLRFKVQGVASEVLAAREGLSEIAFRHRMQRILDRLRHLAEPVSLRRKRPAASVKVTPGSSSSGHGTSAA